MVDYQKYECIFAGLLLVGQPADPVLERLDPPRRAAVIMAIIAITLTGILLVVCVMLGARWVRGIARQKPRIARVNSQPQSTAENLRLRESLGEVLPPLDTEDTVHMRRESGETTTDP